MSNNTMTEKDDKLWYGPEDMPKPDPVLYKQARDSMITRHLLAPLRREAGLTLQDVATKREITKAAVSQTENRPLGKISIGNLLSHLQAIGYEVDEQWAADALSAALPIRN